MDLRAFWRSSTKTAYSCLHKNNEKHAEINREKEKITVRLAWNWT